jgi:hypothetical protein
VLVAGPPGVQPCHDRIIGHALPGPTVLPPVDGFLFEALCGFLPVKVLADGFLCQRVRRTFFLFAQFFEPLPFTGRLRSRPSLDAERRIAELSDGQEILEFLGMARRQAGSTDALKRFGALKNGGRALDSGLK